MARRKNNLEKPKEEIQKIEEDGVIMLIGYKGYLTHHESEVMSGSHGDRIFIPYTPRQVKELIQAKEEGILKEHDNLDDIKAEVQQLETLERILRTWRRARQQSDIKWGEWVRAEAQKNRGK